MVKSMSLQKLSLVVLVFSFLTSSLKAQAQLTYDVGGTSGSSNGTSYSELNLGLNWQFSDYFTWRNAFFHRNVVGQNSVSGIDSSLRYIWSWSSESENLGFKFFAGPGYRFASENNAALLTEAGVGFKFFGIGLGLGVKSLFYQDPGSDSAGKKRESNDVSYFVTISGSGAL
jgi:hypothetical protein